MVGWVSSNNKERLCLATTQFFIIGLSIKEFELQIQKNLPWAGFFVCGVDGTRTRDLLRDREAL